MNNVSNGHSERRSLLNTKSIQRSIQKLKIVSNGLSSITEERLVILELKMLLRPGNSSLPITVKIPTIMYMIWILISTQMSKQLSRVVDTVKIGMVIIIQTNLLVNLTQKEHTQEKFKMATVDMVATVVTAAMAAKAAMADITKHSVVKQDLIKKADLISLVEPTTATVEVTILILIVVEEITPMEDQVATEDKVATEATEDKVATEATVATVATVATEVIKEIQITTMAINSLMI